MLTILLYEIYMKIHEGHKIGARIFITMQIFVVKNCDNLHVQEDRNGI